MSLHALCIVLATLLFIVLATLLFIVLATLLFIVLATLLFIVLATLLFIVLDGYFAVRSQLQSQGSDQHINFYGFFRLSAAQNELSWNTAPLMAETTTARSAQYLTMPTVVDYCGVMHCGTFASLSSLYSAMNSMFLIALCCHDNSSSPPHSILGNHIPVRHIDRNFHHGRFTLVLEAKLGWSNVACAL